MEGNGRREGKGWRIYCGFGTTTCLCHLAACKFLTLAKL